MSADSRGVAGLGGGAVVLGEELRAGLSGLGGEVKGLITDPGELGDLGGVEEEQTGEGLRELRAEAVARVALTFGALSVLGGGCRPEGDSICFFLFFLKG